MPPVWRQTPPEASLQRQKTQGDEATSAKEAPRALKENPNVVGSG